jgi:hypothetical protein
VGPVIPLRIAGLLLIGSACASGAPPTAVIDVGAFWLRLVGSRGESRTVEGTAVVFQNGGDPERPGSRDEFRLDLNSVSVSAEPAGAWALVFTIRPEVTVGSRLVREPRSPDDPYVGALLFPPTGGARRAITGSVTVTSRTRAGIEATFALAVVPIAPVAQQDTLWLSGTVRAPWRTP